MSNDEEREDMLSILRRYRPVYFAVFIVQVIVWCVIMYWWESTSGEHSSDTVGRIIATGLKMAPLTGLSVITTIVLVEMGRYLVVLFLPTPNIRRRMEKAKAKGHAEGIVEGHAEGHAEGIAEGHAEGHAEGTAQERRNWVAWNRRRVEAEAQGLPFDEPPPSENEDDE